MHFARIGIIAKRNSAAAWQMVGVLTQLLRKQGCSVQLDEDSATSNPAMDDQPPSLPRHLLAQAVDLVIVVGGDGTFLETARNIVNWQRPILGINLGRLGFLTDIPAAQMEEMVVSVLAGQFEIEQRLMLRVRIERDGETLYDQLALNDVVLHKVHMEHMIEFEVMIDNRFVQSQRSDGLIIATPTGSTAYALSAGGPILQPSLEALTLVSINPHSMSNRPIVVASTSRIEIHSGDQRKEPAQITCDGHVKFDLMASDRIFIERHSHVVSMVHPRPHDHFLMLRQKLHWGEKL
ncbi:MAG: NAD kinase [Thiotrichales bacterium 32-46-8]|nr:NAD(+) kinase [Gammaproteobacteria bacterium]OYX07477.1 MAG: NAD kinase [Thiotrichales bacterium 32-46-8]OYY24132.1 MAG: NAD kinase [Thiotrichales bacterium 35-46-9]OZA73777.1 MAG: NAD kinase [Thiotrichales bacterium 39-47-5]OZB86607.1 MAG: NAD kinase [Thiotrichales bacterium 12-47-6]UCG18587.1 MAG: NAD(+) kinase [Thiotrichales bacterium]